MKVEVEELEPCKRLLKIEVPREAVVEEFEKVYEEICKTAKIKGFRAGKAPKDLLEKYHSHTASDEVMKRLISVSYRKALSDSGLHPVGLPDISNADLKNHQPFSFDAKVEVKPTFKPPHYRGLKVRRRAIEIGSEDIARALEQLRERNAEFATVHKRPLGRGDCVICDFECFVDGHSVDRQENMRIHMDDIFHSVRNKSSETPPVPSARPVRNEISNRIKTSNGVDISGVVEKLAGALPGETRSAEVILPKHFPRSEYREKKAECVVTIKEIKEKQLPKLDDEFAKDIGGCKNLEELKAEIKRELTAKAEELVKVEMEHQILEQLSTRIEFQIPASMVEQELERLLRDAKIRLFYQGLRKEEVEQQTAELKDKLRGDAMRRVKTALILEKITEVEHIEVSEEELEREIASLAVGLNRTSEEMKSYLESEDLVDDLAQGLRERKTKEFLLKEARIEEV